MVATLEQEIVLFKAKEVDNMNAAKGYETLLKDGIPLNEHFLSLKNKYNREKETNTHRLKELEEEILKTKVKNQGLVRQIEQLKKQQKEGVDILGKAKESHENHFRK